MRGTENFHQVSDDDFFNDGPCPSCRLSINKETGRLKWCVGGNDRRFRIKLLLIPAILLPITIVFIALSRLQVANKSPYYRSYLADAFKKQTEIHKEHQEALSPTPRSDAEERVEEDRNLLFGARTSYVPEDSYLPLPSTLPRRKRQIDREENFSSYKWRSNNYPEAARSKEDIERLEDYGEGLDYSEDGELMNSAKSEGFPLDDQLPVKRNRCSEETEEWQQRNNDEDQMDDSYSIYDEDNEDRWIFNTRDLETETKPDFHAFWKGEGNRKTIRAAQAKIMLGYMDKNADPCEDFYQYACGNWAKLNPIPKDKAGFDTFEMLRESLDTVLRSILEEPIDRDAETRKDFHNDATVKAKHLFQSCMNYEILEQRMEQPLIQLLEEMGGWPIMDANWSPENFDWLLTIAQLRLYNNDILISEWVGPDIKNSDQYVIQFDQTSLGLPTRDYFLQSSNLIYLEAYKHYLIKIATLLGAPMENATVQAEEIIDFETRLATITSSSDERRNISELYQRMSIGELRVLVPQIDWHRYLTIVLARPVNVTEPVVIFALQYIQDLVNLLSKTNPREQAPSRWKNCVAQVNSNMGMAVGSMFVKKYFDENSKNDTLAMTREMQRSFRELLNRTCWIDDDTKRLASEKVNAMFLRIGYPDFILQRDLLNERYKDVVIRPDKYFENTLNILQHLTRVEQDRLGSPVNKTLWNTAPAVVNAYYSRNKNQIMFPAGILQPPFYHRHFPRSLNYGGIGVVIGHEITHGFDDKGRLFDKNGNLHRWWKDDAIDGFHRRAQCLIDQYSQYTVSEVGMRIDGINTQGENIADNGGIKQAFRAYERWLRINGDSEETLPGLNLTGKQLFFLNFAQVWCGSMRPEATKNKLKTAVHSPGKYRVIGTLSNSKDFSEIFNCPVGSPMNPVNKCSVW
ncbi:neprilysin-4-like isoform X2 [Prorops nasuta]|uniref:neprilysin-4-like isoform X2 n=1 Tax=Prorops nasuta TaxID=863751 RepID=UPI0034CD5DFB